MCYFNVYYSAWFFCFRIFLHFFFFLMSWWNAITFKWTFYFRLPMMSKNDVRLIIITNCNLMNLCADKQIEREREQETAIGIFFWHDTFPFYSWLIPFVLVFCLIFSMFMTYRLQLVERAQPKHTYTSHNFAWHFALHTVYTHGINIWVFSVFKSVNYTLCLIAISHCLGMIWH